MGSCRKRDIEPIIHVDRNVYSTKQSVRGTQQFRGTRPLQADLDSRRSAGNRGSTAVQDILPRELRSGDGDQAVIRRHD